jgi:hypothetical protein
MATLKQIKAARIIVENHGEGKTLPLGQILLRAGYRPATAKNPAQIVESRGFQELLDEVLPDELLSDVHLGLLKSTKIEHMVFPLGPKRTEEDVDKLSDETICEMLAEVNCTVRRIVHQETARHVYFWAPDTSARQAALKLAYDVKGRISKGNGGADPGAAGPTFNQFNIGDQTPRGNEMVEGFVEYMKRSTLPAEPSTEVEVS